MFGLRVGSAELRRRRWFELGGFSMLTPPCQHGDLVCGVYGGSGGDSRRIHRPGPQRYTVAERRIAMGIDWMTGAELNQAVPPAYSEYLGRQVLEILRRRAQGAQRPA